MTEEEFIYILARQFFGHLLPTHAVQCVKAMLRAAPTIRERKP